MEIPTQSIEEAQLKAVVVVSILDVIPGIARVEFQSVRPLIAKAEAYGVDIELVVAELSGVIGIAREPAVPAQAEAIALGIEVVIRAGEIAV